MRYGGNGKLYWLRHLVVTTNGNRAMRSSKLKKKPNRGIRGFKKAIKISRNRLRLYRVGEDVRVQNFND